MSSTVFLIALVIAGGTLVSVAGAISSAFRGRGGGDSRPDVAQRKKGKWRGWEAQSEVAELRKLLEEQRAALESQSAQLAELQERVDFAERLLAQVRDRAALGKGE